MVIRAPTYAAADTRVRLRALVLCFNLIVKKFRGVEEKFVHVDSRLRRSFHEVFDAVLLGKGLGHGFRDSALLFEI